MEKKKILEWLDALVKNRKTALELQYFYKNEDGEDYFSKTIDVVNSEIHLNSVTELCNKINIEPTVMPFECEGYIQIEYLFCITICRYLLLKIIGENDMPNQIENVIVVDSCWDEIEYGISSRARLKKERLAFEDAEYGVEDEK